MNPTLERLSRRATTALGFWHPEGAKGIAKKGHRRYVGGMWDQIGALQLEFLVSRGLKPHSYLLDIACGALRLGVKAIPYLERGHYLGIEKESGLIEAGLERELDLQVRRDKQPNIIVSDSFEFEKLGRKADFAIAQSLFTHLPAEVIDLCLMKLRPWLDDDGVFFATFQETQRRLRNPRKPHDHGYFAYTRDEMSAFGEARGFAACYIGDWGHPRGQVMMEYRKR